MSVTLPLPFRFYFRSHSGTHLESDRSIVVIHVTDVLASLQIWFVIMIKGQDVWHPVMQRILELDKSIVDIALSTIDTKCQQVPT